MIRLKQVGWIIICFLMLINIFLIYLPHNKKKSEEKTEVVAAFIRVKNEIHTVEACLKSIEGVFDKIVIIYVDEPDDGTVAFVKKWCDERKECIHDAYPYAVFPSYDKAYRGKYDSKNSLAAYYNFGLEKFDPEDWVVKIDADQVYITPFLKKFVSYLKNYGKLKPKTSFGLIGYNTFEWHGQFVYLSRSRINGGEDHFVAKRKNLLSFGQTVLYERHFFQEIDKTEIHRVPVWFHFIKSIKSNGEVFSRQAVDEKQISHLKPAEIELFETYVRPLLPDYSIYKNIRLQ